MKKLTLLLAAFATFLQYSKAQSQWSVGLRTGAELSKSNNLSLDQRRTGILLNEQLFITKRLYKHLELELNTAYKGTVTNSEFSNQIWDGPEYYASTVTYNTLEVGLALRYFILDKAGWAPYILGGVNANKQFIRNNTLSKDPYKSISDITERKTTMNNIPSEYYLGIGVNRTIASHWKLNAQLTMAYDYNAVYYSYYLLNDYSPKLQIGLAYCW